MKLLVLFLLMTPRPTQDAPASQSSIEQLYDQAIASVAAADWDDAIAKLNTILEFDPSHLPSKFYLAVSLNGSGKPEEAIAIYRAILAEDGTVFEARMNLAALLFENGSLFEAAEEFGRARELAPDDPTPVLYRAQVLAQMGRVDEAIEAYETVLALEPDTETAGEAYRRLGTLHLRADRPDVARDMLIEAVRLGVEDSFVFATLGDDYASAGDLENARTYYERALDRDPGNRDLGVRLALILRDLDLPDDAVALLEEMDGVDDLLADSYMAAGRYADAVRVYAVLTVREPENADNWQGLGLGDYRLGEYDRAVPALERAAAIEPDRYDAWGTLASIYYQREDWVKARAMLLKYLQIRPDHAASVFLLATCDDYLRDYEQALLHYNRFIELDDGSDDARSFQVQQRARSLRRFLEDR